MKGLFEGSQANPKEIFKKMYSLVMYNFFQLARRSAETLVATDSLSDRIVRDYKGEPLFFTLPCII